jgi:hypothetical protein
MTAVLRPEGRSLFAGLLALPVPDDPWGAVWRHGDRLREYRGDAHIAVWASDGFDPVEIGLLTEPYWGLPLKSYIRSRAWSEEQLDAGIDRLRSRGLLTDEGLTDDGRAVRESIEERTDHAMRAAPTFAATTLTNRRPLAAGRRRGAPGPPAVRSACIGGVKR